MRHKDRIPDLLEWKRLPDHFYFSKFFDPYIKREFEVIRTVNVNNSEQFEIHSWSIFYTWLIVSHSSLYCQRCFDAPLRIPDHRARDGSRFDRRLPNLLLLPPMVFFPRFCQMRVSLL